MSELRELAERVVAHAKTLGANQVNCTVSEGRHVTITRRGGKVEQATEATTRGLVVSVLVNDRYSSSSTSDLRPEALEGFLKRTVDATEYLEAEPERALPPGELCGRGVSDEALDQNDPAYHAQSADERSSRAEHLESSARLLDKEDVISGSVYVADGFGRSVRVMSNGFSDENEGAWFALGGDLTLQDGDKRPESGAYFAARHLSDLPTPEQVAAEIDRRTRERIGATPIDSGAYPMLLSNRCAGRILGMLGGPLSGGALHNRRSCLHDKLGQTIGSSLLTLIDDPTIPRGMGSRPWDGDGLRSTPRTIITNGQLEQFNIGIYHGRKLGQSPTSGSRSNWVIPPGENSPSELLKSLPKAIVVTGFLGGNGNGTTGDFSLGIRGLLMEHGVPTQSLAEMNVSGNILEIFHQLVAVADDPWSFSSTRSPSLLFEDVQFSGN